MYYQEKVFGREKKQKDFIKLINNSVEEYSNVFSIRRKSEIEYDLNNKNAPIVLIEAGNASGKTTLLQAIAFGLNYNRFFEDDTEWISKNNRSFINNKSFKEGKERVI